jgi:hypothetical protein
MDDSYPTPTCVVSATSRIGKAGKSLTTPMPFGLHGRAVRVLEHKEETDEPTPAMPRWNRIPRFWKLRQHTGCHALFRFSLSKEARKIIIITYIENMNEAFVHMHTGSIPVETRYRSQRTVRIPC